jgi:hypothetical protein
MHALSEPAWPVVLLAIVCVVDAALCWKPVGFIARCFAEVGWPRRYWPMMAPIKLAAAAGLLAGIWVPWLGPVTTGCLILYFLVAISMHVRARDLGRNLFVNAIGMLLLCLAVFVFCFLV